MMSSNYFGSPQRASSIFRKYQMNLMTKVPTWSIYLISLVPLATRNGTSGCWCECRWYCSCQKSAKSFLDHLACQMDHTVSQWCTIYQLENVRIKPGETPDELVNHLKVLANRFNFPNRWVKGTKCPILSSLCLHRQWADHEISYSWPQSHRSQDAWNMQDSHSYSRQPQYCWPQIQNCQCCQQMEPMTSVSSTTTATKNFTPQTNMHVGIALSPMHLAEPPALPRTPHANHVAELVTGTSDAEAPPVNRRIQTRSYPDIDPKVENKSRPTLLM